MELFWEGLLTLLAAMGLALVGSLLFARLLYPIPGSGLCVLVPGRGGGELLERDIRSLMWLRGLGLLRCQVAIVDLSLTDRGRQLALRLVKRWPEVALWPSSALEELLHEEP